MYNNNKKLKKILSTQLGHKPLLSIELVFWGIDTLLLKSVHNIFHTKPPSPYFKAPVLQCEIGHHQNNHVKTCS